MIFIPDLILSFSNRKNIEYVLKDIYIDVMKKLYYEDFSANNRFRYFTTLVEKMHIVLDGNGRMVHALRKVLEIESGDLTMDRYPFAID